MIYNVNELRKDTAALIRDIDIQINAVKEGAKAIGVEPHNLVDQNANFVMAPLLAAKATAYNTLVMLQSSEPTRTPGRQGRYSV